MAQGNDMKAQRLSVGTFVEWTDRMADRFGHVSITTDSPDNFRAVLKNYRAGDVHMTFFEASAQQSIRRQIEDIQPDDPTHLKFTLVLDGSGFIVQDGRESVLTPGDVAFYDTSRPYSTEFDSRAKALIIAAPPTILSTQRQYADQLTATNLATHSGPSLIVTAYLKKLAEEFDCLQGHAGLMLAYNTVELINTLMRSEVGISSSSPELSKVQEYILRNLDQPHLTPSHIAAENFISTRQLHYLFEETGTTVSRWTRNLRLKKCSEDLADPALKTKPVSQIAHRWGFSDTSHFSKAFKSSFGTSPSQFRLSNLRPSS